MYVFQLNCYIYSYKWVYYAITPDAVMFNDIGNKNK